MGTEFVLFAACRETVSVTTKETTHHDTFKHWNNLDSNVRWSSLNFQMKDFTHFYQERLNAFYYLICKIT
jgi:hypothetical protein